MNKLDHLYKHDYFQTKSKTQSNIKKNLDQFIEQQLQTIEIQNQQHMILDSSDDSQMEFENDIINDKDIKVYINKEYQTLPIDIINLTKSENFMNMDEFKQIFNEEEQNHLKTFLPKQLNNEQKEQTIKELLEGSLLKQNNPFQGFLDNLKKGNYTHFKNKEKELDNKIAVQSQMQYYEDLIYDIKEKSNQKNVDILKRRCVKRKAQQLLKQEMLSEDENTQQSEQCINNLVPERGFSEISKGYTTQESEYQELKEKKAEQEKLEELIEQNKLTGEQVDITSLPLSLQPNAKQIQKKLKEDYIQKARLEQLEKQTTSNIYQQLNTEDNSKQYSQQQSYKNNNNQQQQQSGQNNSSFYQQQKQIGQNSIKQEYQGQNNQKQSVQKNGTVEQTQEQRAEEIAQKVLSLGNFGNTPAVVSKSKNIYKQSASSNQPVQSLYRLPTTLEWIKNYRQQEQIRYQNPTRPWKYVLQNGKEVCVGPVTKKVTSTSTSKAREHPLLKDDRMPYITILCLVKDAAAKLINGEGTRFDICELLKESHYIVDQLDTDKLSNIVSGALDRLHYADDPCVRYDMVRKLWLYTHYDRTLEHPEWQESYLNDDSNKEPKKNQKKKQKMFMDDQ